MVETVSGRLLSPALLSLRAEFSAGGWAAFVSTILWFRGFWTSASVTEVMVVPTLRWLLTLGLIPSLFLVFFVAVCGEEAPTESRSIAVIRTLSHWSTLFLCTLAVSQHPASLLPAEEGGMLQSRPVRSPSVVRWELSPAAGLTLLGLAFGGLSDPSSSPPSHALVVLHVGSVSRGYSLLRIHACAGTATRASDICRLCTLFSSIKLHS